MTPAEIASIASLLALITQALTSAIKTRQDLGTNITQTEQANLAAAHTNFQSVISAAQSVFTPTT